MSKIYLIVLFAAVAFANPIQERELNPDTGLNTLELIEKYGFPVERHPVVTEDGYIVEMHRIPYGRNNRDEKLERPPVLIMHGLMSSSADWVNFGEKSLAFLLADRGYDVWLGNARGNFWSKNHTTLDPKVDDDFWKYSWHEIGFYDLPAMIDHLLIVSGAEKLFYIGHSQGGTAFFVLNSMRPEYNDKIRLMTGLAPASFTEHVKTLLLQLAAEFLEDIEKLAELFGIYEFLPHSALNEILGEQVCIEENNMQEFCTNLLLLAMGGGSDQLNSSMINVIVTNAPSGSSTKQYLHYGQGIKYGTFSQYSYGPEENLIRYGSEVAPPYELSKITTPTAIFHSLNDDLVQPLDVERLVANLGNVVKTHLVDYDKFNHIDYLWANDIMPLLYDHVLELISQY